MRWPTAFRVAVALVWWCCCRCLLWLPPTAAGLGAATDAPTALAFRDWGGGTSRWRDKHKGGGVGVGGGGVASRTSHRRHGGGQPEVELNVGMLVPKTSFGVRGYLRAINGAMHEINKATKKNRSMTYNKLYDFETQNVRYRMMSLTPSPTGR